MTKKKRISVLLIMFAVVIGLGVLTFVLGNKEKHETIQETMKDAVLHGDNKDICDTEIQIRSGQIPITD